MIMSDLKLLMLFASVDQPVIVLCMIALGNRDGVQGWTGWAVEQQRGDDWTVCVEQHFVAIMAYVSKQEKKFHISSNFDWPKAKRHINCNLPPSSRSRPYLNKPTSNSCNEELPHVCLTLWSCCSWVVQNPFKCQSDSKTVAQVLAELTLETHWTMWLWISLRRA